MRMCTARTRNAQKSLFTCVSQSEARAKLTKLSLDFVYFVDRRRPARTPLTPVHLFPSNVHCEILSLKEITNSARACFVD